MKKGYYSDRISELESRKAELQGRLVTTKLSLNSVNKEIEACKEAMNNQTKPMRTDADRKDEKILSLNKEIAEAEVLISNLKLENTQLKHDLQNSNEKINNLEQEISNLKRKLSIMKNFDDDDTIYSKKRPVDNIFEQFMDSD